MNYNPNFVEARKIIGIDGQFKIFFDCKQYLNIVYKFPLSKEI